MKNFKELLDTEKKLLIISLPDNSYEYALRAYDAGADAEPPDAPISMDATADSESEIAVESGADSSNSAPPDSSDDPSNSSDEPSEGGCGCKVNGSPSTRSWYVFPLGFLALGVFAQRRRGGCAIVDRG